MQRLAVVLSAAALVIALLGTTPLGNAAEKTVKKVVRVGKAENSSARGPRGKRGPRGARGPRGFQGPPGEKGDPGSPTDGFEARRTTPIEISATTAETATTVLTSAPLPAGKYAFSGEIVLHGTGNALVTCQARGPATTGPRLGVPATLRVGSGPDSVRDGTLPLAFGATFATAGPVSIGCWLDSSAAPRPTAAANLVAVTVLHLAQSGS
ncbi:MAG TPA: collagen-like protein [Gaiellaceae bacterium]